MKPYYDKDGITIYHGDCREILPRLKSVDLVLTDPPYGVGMEYGQYEDTQKELRNLIGSSFRMVVEHAEVTALTPGIKNLHLYPAATWCLVWIWGHTGTTGGWGFNQWGPILVWGKDPYLRQGLGRHPDVIRCGADDEFEFGHPCAKPIKAWQAILRRLSTKESDVVLDPFMGSGTTLVAAKKTLRRAIGIEIEEKYCEIAARRLELSKAAFKRKAFEPLFKF